MLNLLILVATMLSGPCVVDSEHTCVVVINCDNYTLAGPALYQQDAMQWCPSRI